MRGGECLYDSTSSSSHWREYTHPCRDTHSTPEARDPHRGARMPEAPKKPSLRQLPPILSLSHTMAPTALAHLNEGNLGHTYPALYPRMQTHWRGPCCSLEPGQPGVPRPQQRDIRTRVYTRKAVHLHACTLSHTCTHPVGMHTRPFRPRPLHLRSRASPAAPAT